MQVTIRTDGTVNFGSDLIDFINLGEDRFDPRPVTSFRLRLLGARARLPALVDIGTYPVDAAVVTLGRTEFQVPFFSNFRGLDAEPRVDIELRFYVPVVVSRFNPRGTPNGGIRFDDILGPREVGVELGSDRRSIVVTVIPDRADIGAAARLQRSPRDAHRRRFSVTRVAGAPANEMVNALPAPSSATPARFRVEALHTPLAELLGAASRAMNLEFSLESTGRTGTTSGAATSGVVTETDGAARGVEDTDITMLLPAATPQEFLNALANGYGLSVTPRTDAAGGGFSLGRGEASVVERVPLRHLSPESARLLLPDFLLPLLRADRESNALLVTAPPQLVARIKRDLARLDQPRPQVRVETVAWEFSSTADANFVLRAARVTARGSQSIETDTGAVSIRLERGQRESFAATVEALAARGRARLRAAPFVVVASGEPGTLFLGQTRFVTVVQNSFGGAEARALRLQIGYSLSVTPRVGAGGDITLELNPRFSTVDAIESGTGLPTLGIREANATIRLRPGDAVMLGGLDSDLDFDTRRILGSRRRSRTRTALLLLVTARRV